MKGGEEVGRGLRGSTKAKRSGQFRTLRPNKAGGLPATVEHLMVKDDTDAAYGKTPAT